MPAVSTNVSGNNSRFFIYLNWKFTPDKPSFSSVSTTNSRTSITVNATVAAPTTGSFTISQIRGGRTDSYNSWSASAVNNVKQNINGTAHTREKCTVYFNKSGTSMADRHAWGNVGATYSGVATGTGKYINIAITKSDSSTCNGKYFNTKNTLNLATSQSIGYSMDNTNFQSSPTFTGLTPNTTYTFYIRSRATSYTDDSSDFVYTTVTGKTLGAKVWVKVNGSWVLGTCYVKKNGSWVVANEVDVKSGGTWKPGIN